MASSPYPWLKPAVLVGGLSPVALLALDFARGALGANPIERVLHQTGMLALIVLVASLACTPLKLLFGWTWPLRIRKLLGLLGFAYAVMHFLTYAVLDQGLAWGALLADITKRPFITVGFLALVLLVPLAVTSTNRMVRRLGFPTWQRLHRLVYVAVSLGVVHFIWRVKKDLTEPLVYACVLGLLLAVRVAESVRKRRTRASLPAT
ncbi:sulfite oxidase heme-binding subunit YedZ [Melittangium boletus]|uniref:Protein-methionine-sulfoxide reductase heme-binding subunit MsrQ n=1 Tax=Melittangium boletus DSM 14713 TaxID=1294270 RepID=A0A250IAW4_9BACT|nr:protein-methionine-sulfoxide reductase heme-binding subunit MsrQ [Melittangium boletus]ATB28350.1 sulfoxide reductase heme-binding subunit YedZ [Melittangium boletus DSM 14713]